MDEAKTERERGLGGGREKKRQCLIEKERERDEEEALRGVRWEVPLVSTLSGEMCQNGEIWAFLLPQHD